VLTWPTPEWTVPCACGGLGHGVLALRVVGNDDAGHGAIGAGDSHRSVDGVPHLGRIGHEGRVLGGDVLEQGDQVDLLLI
jgi:hypothetical protein